MKNSGAVHPNLTLKLSRDFNRNFSEYSPMNASWFVSIKKFHVLQIPYINQVIHSKSPNHKVTLQNWLFTQHLKANTGRKTLKKKVALTSPGHWIKKTIHYKSYKLASLEAICTLLYLELAISARDCIP